MRNQYFWRCYLQCVRPCNAMCFILFTVTSIHNIRKYTKIRNSKKKMEGDRRFKVYRKVWRKMKKMFKRRNWLIHTQVETNFATVAEELVSSENIASYVWEARYTLMISLLSLMKYTINLFPANCQTTWSYSRSIEIYKLNDSLRNKQKLRRLIHSYSSLVFVQERIL